MLRLLLLIALVTISSGCSDPAPTPSVPDTQAKAAPKSKPVNKGGSEEVSPPLPTGDEKAVAFVTRMGGRGTRDEKLPGNPVTYVNLEHSKITDAGLKELAAFKSIALLSLGSTKITDAGLKELAALKSLSALNLNSTKITDAGLRELAALKNLTSLSLVGTKITDAGLKNLAAFKNLTSVTLNSTEVTDAGVAELQKALPNCKIEQ